ncbi:MAG TPA: outer membrane lipoprotein-sorting protein, partial [Paracoccaceae bacterium]|nr:outer membrane lipoprotein-sorting protein [Paracoccaceae bacterium]
MQISKSNALIALTTALALAFGATHVTAQSARAIVERMDENAQMQNDSSFSVLKISTCKFGISNNKVKCTARPTVKTLESASITVGRNGKDAKSIAFVLEPASERGIGMLSYTYDDANKDNETWLYLSALGKVKRIVASNSTADSQPVSLFGSEFTTEDQETGKLDEYAFNLLDTVTYQGNKAYVIEQI